MEWSRILYNICDGNVWLGAFYPEESKANMWITSGRRIFRTNFIIQGECVHNVYRLLFAAKANIGWYDHVQRKNRHGYRNLSISALWFELILACTLIVLAAITVLEYRTRHSQLWLALYFSSILHIILGATKN